MRGFFTLFLAFLSLIPASAGAAEYKDYVVLLHGIARTSGHMSSIAIDLRAHGYRVININYPSREYTIEELADIIHPRLEKPAADKDYKVHFVGYSMGGLITRAYIARHRPENLGRVVMIGTPNGGSEVADWLKDFAPYRWIYGPAGQQLVTGIDRDKEYGPVSYELGVIAGNGSIDPVSSHLVIKTPSDGKVSVVSTHLAGEKDHVLLPVSHTFLPTDKRVVRQVRHFIENGSFERRD